MMKIRVHLVEPTDPPTTLRATAEIDLSGLVIGGFEIRAKKDERDGTYLAVVFPGWPRDQEWFSPIGGKPEVLKIIRRRIMEAYHDACNEVVFASLAAPEPEAGFPYNL